MSLNNIVVWKVQQSSGHAFEVDVCQTFYRFRHLDCGVSETRCCRYPVFNVSFRELQMDSWILEPQNLSDLRLQRLVFPELQHRAQLGPNQIQSMGSRSSQSQLGLRHFICTATKFGPLSIAHYNRDGQLVVQILDNSIAEECMCAWRPDLFQWSL